MKASVKASIPALLICMLTVPMLTLTCCTTYSQVLLHQQSEIALLNQSLMAVQNYETAQAAIPAVQRYGNVLSRDLDRIFDNGKPTLLELLALKNTYQNSSLSTEAKTSLREIFRIARANFYGCTELRRAMIVCVLEQVQGPDRIASSVPVQQSSTIADNRVINSVINLVLP